MSYNSEVLFQDEASFSHSGITEQKCSVSPEKYILRVKESIFRKEFIENISLLLSSVWGISNQGLSALATGYFCC